MSKENQHWVPKFLIRNFADTDGRVFCLDVVTDEITKPPPKNAASDLGFYEFIMDGETVSYEDRLEKIETQAAPILKGIVSSRSLSGMNRDQRNRIANFTAAQSFRTNAFFAGLEFGSSRQQFGAVFEQLWRSAFLVSDEIMRRQWVLMVIENADVFYLGDQPVVLQHTENPSAGSQMGFDIEGVEAFLPVTPKCALYMPCTSISRQIISGYESALTIHTKIRWAAIRGKIVPGTDSGSLQLSQRVMRNTYALYQALTTGDAIAAAPENVENLNYLQCAWAHTAVYSNRRDFEFARRVFRETPQYRKSPRTALGKPRIAFSPSA